MATQAPSETTHWRDPDGRRHRGRIDLAAFGRAGRSFGGDRREVVVGDPDRIIES
jgi:hypothetical protein